MAPLSKMEFPRIVAVVTLPPTLMPTLELPEMMLAASGVSPPTVIVVGPRPPVEIPHSFGTGAAAFLSRPMMFPWTTELDPPLKLLPTKIAELVFPERRLRSWGLRPPNVALTVPPWVKAMEMPI